MNPTGTKSVSNSTTSHMQQAGDALNANADKTIDSTRDYANDMLDKAEGKVRELRGNVDPMIDMLATKAQKLARQSLDMAAEAKDRAQQSLNRAAGATTRYVSEQPLRSILMAAAVGATIALLVSVSRNSSSNKR